MATELNRNHGITNQGHLAMKPKSGAMGGHSGSHTWICMLREGCPARVIDACLDHREHSLEGGGELSIHIMESLDQWCGLSGNNGVSQHSRLSMEPHTCTCWCKLLTSHSIPQDQTIGCIRAKWPLMTLTSPWLSHCPQTCEWCSFGLCGA